MRVTKIKLPGRFVLLVFLALILIPAATAQNVQYLLHGDGGRLDWNDHTQLLVLDRTTRSIPWIALFLH